MNQALIFTSESPQRQCVAVGILDDQLIEDLEQFVIRVDQTLPQGVVSNVASVFITDGKIIPLLKFDHALLATCILIYLSQ